MRLLFLILVLSSSTIFANTSTNTPQTDQSDAFHNSAFGAPAEGVLPQKQEESSSEWNSSHIERMEEKPSNRVNEWQEQSQRAKSGEEQ